MSLLDRHHVYLQTLDLVQSTRRIPYRSFPYVMVLGDSWLDYPGRNREFIAHPTNMMRTFMAAQRSSANWYDLAVSGATTRQLSGHLPKLKQLARDVQFDYIMVSAGGNDYFEKSHALLKDYNPLLSPSEHLEEAAFALVDHTVGQFYRKLVELRDRYQPKALIVGHGYLPPIALDEGFLRIGPIRIGPWISPAMRDKGYFAATREFRNLVITEMQARVSEAIRLGLSEADGPAPHRNYFFDAREHPEALALRDRSDWADEIHLSVAGYLRYTQVMIDDMVSKHLFPFRKNQALQAAERSLRTSRNTS
ncbi:SGNH/GDSL hydrolase family protein [Allohahella marinimesophila]|uniref:SGNH hydrolase-type esterase domain-containing protein n=1 Tax=Allohahella marinimesophila TaxID=1054972 RepID=A0ABP7NQI5_9GAMM